MKALLALEYDIEPSDTPFAEPLVLLRHRLGALPESWASPLPRMGWVAKTACAESVLRILKIDPARRHPVAFERMKAERAVPAHAKSGYGARKPPDERLYAAAALLMHGRPQLRHAILCIKTGRYDDARRLLEDLDERMEAHSEV